MSVQITKDLVNGRILFVIDGSTVATGNRSGWFNGNYNDNGGTCKGIKIQYSTNFSYYKFDVVETDDSLTLIGYIARRKA